MVHEIADEPFDGGRVLARGHIDHAVLHEVGDDRDAVVAFAAGLVDADGLDARVVLRFPRLVDVVGDEPPQAGVGLVDLFGGRADGQVEGHLHGPRLEQEREPAAGPGPRGGNRPHAVRGTGGAGHGGVDERLVLEEVQVPPHAFPRVMHRAGGLAASRLGATEARAGLEADRDVQLLTAVSRVPEVHGPHLPGRSKLQRGGERTRGIHASNLPDRHHPTPNHPP